MESHLLQMRGLKQDKDNSGITESLVASFTDAWIETLLICATIRMNWVASFTDAWIETVGSMLLTTSETKSHLLQMRGLKPNK